MESFPNSFESPETKITFKNQPELLPYDSESKKNERKLALVPHIEEFIANDEMFAGKEVEVEFSRGSASSLVCYLTTAEGKYVFKIPVMDRVDEGEAAFLNEWEAHGVSVPHVHKEGQIGGRNYLLMDFVEGELLLKTSQDFSQDEKNAMHTEMGTILQKMHTSKVEGYGAVKEGRPQYAHFRDWLYSDENIGRIKPIAKLQLLGDEHGPIEKALEILREYEEQNPGSNYCHFDYTDYNIIDTAPYTVFDPNPIFVPGVMDMGRSALMLARMGEYNGVEKMKEGYFSTDKPYDERALQASIILTAYIKFNRWNKIKKLSHIEHVQKYLLETRSRLG
jgi:hypothetical protein